MKIIHPDKRADDNRRDMIKDRIDSVGRKDFSRKAGVSYMVMSQQLNGASVLRECVADYYEKLLEGL